MNKIFNKIAVAATVSAAVLGVSSCTDLLDLPPIDYPGSGSFWKTQTEFTGNIYANSVMMRNQTANILFWAGELRSGTFTTDLINASGALSQEIISNTYDVANAQFATFGGYYGFVANRNELIKQTTNAADDILTDNVRNGILGIAHGWRAFAYFQMYKMYGGVPLRLEPQVQEGEIDPVKLYMPRSSAQATLDQIKDDIRLSLEYFGKSTWTPNSATKDYFWSKAASEMLAGEVYLWSGKVSTGNHTANAADVATAKGYFENVINNYGYELVKDYFSIWTTPHNKEFIYSICFSSMEDGATYSSYQGQMCYAPTHGGATGTVGWTNISADGLGIRTDGAVSRFNQFTTAPDQSGVFYTTWSNFRPSPNRYMYKNALYFQYDDKDIRKNIFQAVWDIKPEEEEAGTTYIADFDPTQYTMHGSFSLKFKPSLILEWSNSYIWNNDQAIYRLPLAYLYLAEIANYEGNNADVVKYINLVRERAYGANWDVNKYGYKAGSFRENEFAVLNEKNKEFVMEGQRWWDLRRMTAVKGGTDTDHFVFQPESCPGFGLDPIANPWMVENTGVPILVATPLLTTAEKHKVLWPINQDLLDSDPEIKQNPGYGNADNEFTE